VQLAWPVRGLRTWIVTTGYPATPEPQPAQWRGRPVLDPQACRAADGCAACLTVCLPQALHLEGTAASVDGSRPDRLVLDYGRCIMCGLCVPTCPTGAMQMRPEYELAVCSPADLRVTVRWDTGSGGAR
jgi:formate hydrogenlyase subunit 6/NADH:ubiquinone oxidoreductase subunit I